MSMYGKLQLNIFYNTKVIGLKEKTTPTQEWLLKRWLSSKGRAEDQQHVFFISLFKTPYFDDVIEKKIFTLLKNSFFLLYSYRKHL